MRILRGPCIGEEHLRKYKHALSGAALLLGVSTLAAQAQMVEPTTPPEPPSFDAQGQVEFVGVKDIFEYKALPEYHEPAYVTENFVDEGLLPPVAERLPKEPLVFKTANMPDGIGVYGDAMRHVIGGRPQAWNFWGGLNYGWGGIDNGMHECLTRTGPLFEVKAEELEPLPNLAKSWEWSEDGHTLTMHIVEGIKWSDGDPFDTEDLMFYWNDHVLDPDITPTGPARRRNPSARRRPSRPRTPTPWCGRSRKPSPSSTSTPWRRSARRRRTSSSRCIRRTTRT